MNQMLDSSLGRTQHRISQLLLFNGCVPEDDIAKAVSVSEEAPIELNIRRIVQQINAWHEGNDTSFQIESYQWIDGRTYVGWTTSATDEVSKHSMTALTTKQLKSWRILLNIALANAGLFSMKAVVAMNRKLGIRDILSRIEQRSLLKVLEDGQYIVIISDPEIDAQRFGDLDQTTMATNPYYVIGPRSFIDLKMWIEQKSDYSQFECPLCSDYVLYRGFRCGNGRCPGTVHRACITTYFSSVSSHDYKCPTCQNTVAMQGMDGLTQFIRPLCHPDDAVQIANQLEGAAVKFEPVQQPKNGNTNDSDDESMSE